MRTLIAFVLAVASLAAQHNHPGPPPSEKPVTLLSGLGVYSHRIVTSNAEAQKFFDQGLNLLYGFNRYEALRSFHKAAELDPTAVMPLWGIAMAMGPSINMDMDGDVNLKEGCEALSKAKKLGASTYERGYIEAAASRCPEYNPKSYSEATRQLYNQNPDDLDAATLYAESLMIPVRWKWWSADGSPAGEMAKAVQVLEQVMRRNPDHPGANHFYIHAVEMSPSPERAIPSAQRLMGIVPAAGHLVHMPAHIWVILGEWDIAATVNERAAQVDREYFAQTGVQSGYIGYYVHNLHFIAYSRAMEGRAGEAIAASDLIAKEAAPAIESMSEMIDSFIAYPTFIRVRFGRWDELLAASKPPDKLLASTAVWHWSRALAYTAKGDTAAAIRETDLFGSAKAKVPATWPWVNNKAAEMLGLAEIILEARRAPGDAAAVQHWRRAVELQDRLAYDEPPPWYMPLRESLGGSLLRAGQADQAELVFREGLRRSPRNGRMLFGLMKSLEKQDKKEATDFVRQEFERSWKNADVKLRVEDL